MNTTTRTRMRPEERRQQILNVALELFAKRGFEEVTIGDIAAEMDIVRPTIYIYFPSTNAILDAFFENLLESYWQKLEPLIKSAGDIVPNHNWFPKPFASCTVSPICYPFYAAAARLSRKNVTPSSIKNYGHCLNPTPIAIYPTSHQ